MTAHVVEIEANQVLLGLSDSLRGQWSLVSGLPATTLADRIRRVRSLVSESHPGQVAKRTPRKGLPIAGCAPDPIDTVPHRRALSPRHLFTTSDLLGRSARACQ